jgi:D-alanine-D-alanine ligase
MQKIGVLRGGMNPEYEFSLETGAEVARAIQEAGLEAVDMLLDRDGVLHVKGVPIALEEVPVHVDFVWNALHGTHAEDGAIGELLDSVAVPHTGPSKVVSELTFNKLHTKEQAKTLLGEHGLKTPPAMLILPDEESSVAGLTRKVYTTFAPPWIVKPLSGSASQNTHIAHTMLELSQIIEECISHQTPFMVEQYIFGQEVAVGVIDEFRGQTPYVLPTVSINRPSRGILSEEARSRGGYASMTGKLNRDARHEIEALAAKLHTNLGLKSYSQSEFVVDARGQVWFIEIDSQPHLRKHDPFLLALDAVGASIKDFVHAVIGSHK